MTEIADVSHVQTLNARVVRIVHQIIANFCEQIALVGVKKFAHFQDQRTKGLCTIILQS